MAIIIHIHLINSNNNDNTLGKLQFFSTCMRPILTKQSTIWIDNFIFLQNHWWQPLCYIFTIRNTWTTIIAVLAFLWLRCRWPKSDLGRIVRTLFDYPPIIAQSWWICAAVLGALYESVVFVLCLAWTTLVV